MPVRPPKRWFKTCVKKMSKKKKITDPKAFCGWTWHHRLPPAQKRKIVREEEKARRTKKRRGK